MAHHIVNSEATEAALMDHMIETGEANEEQFLRGADPLLMHAALNTHNICDEVYEEA